MPPQNRIVSINRKAAGRLLLAAFIICAIAIGYLLYWSAQFRIVSTTPSMSAFPAGSPVLFIDFSQPLAHTTLTTSWSPNVNSTYSINGSRLTLNIRSTLAVNKQYHLTVTGVRNQQGNAYGDIAYSFTAQDIQYNDMPVEIQQALLRSQDQGQPPSRNTMIFVGTDALINQGLSALQTEVVKQAVFLFGQSQKKTFNTVTVDASSVQSTPHDPESESTDFGMTCTLNIDGTVYAAMITYHDLTNAELVLKNPATGAQVYDSGDLDSSIL